MNKVDVLHYEWASAFFRWVTIIRLFSRIFCRGRILLSLRKSLSKPIKITRGSAVNQPNKLSELSQRSRSQVEKPAAVASIDYQPIGNSVCVGNQNVFCDPRNVAQASGLCLFKSTCSAWRLCERGIARLSFHWLHQQRAVRSKTILRESKRTIHR